MGRFVRIPCRFAVEPLEVMRSQRMGRILDTPQDYRSWEAKEKHPSPPVRSGTWYNQNKEEAEPFDLRPGDIVEVDIDDLLNRYILHQVAEARGYQSLATALHTNDLDTVEDLLDILVKLENV